MPVVRQADAVPFEVHGSRFLSYIRATTSSSQLCAWRLEVPAQTRGMPHRPDREEILLVLDGGLTVTLEGGAETLRPGDAVLLPANGEVRIDAGAEGGAAWVTTSPGLKATMQDGTSIAPPWAQ